MKVIELSGDVGWEITAKSLKNKLPKDGSDVRLKIDSYGGSVFEGVRLYNVIKDYQGPIVAELGAIAASAASFFPLSADRIEVRENTTFMGHKSWSIAIGNSDDMMLEAEILDGLDNIIAAAYDKKTGKGKEQILADMRDEFWISGGQSIVDSGFADGISESDSEESGSDPVEKSEAAARIAQIKTRLQTSEQYNEEMKRAASILTEKKNEIENIPVLPGNNNLQEADMTLKEYLEKYPDAQAEVDSLVKSALVMELNTAKTEERTRIAGIMKLAYIKNEGVIEAINSDMSSGDFAIAKVTQENETRQSTDNSGGSLKTLNATNTAPADTVPDPVKQPKGVTGATKEQAAEIEAWDKIYDKEAV